MASWGKLDQADNAPLWAASSVNAAPSTANRTSLFGSTTADAFITGSTIGLFNTSATEIGAGTDKGAHAGWNLRVTGSGGRAGRIQAQTLVCLTSNS